MRSNYSITLPFALLFAAPVFAQQPAPLPPAPTVAAPVTAPTPPPGPALLVIPTPALLVIPTPALLVIPAPPGAKLRVEMDARSEDLLGMVKSFLKGVGETGPTPSAQAGKAPANPIADALEAGNLADTLKDVNHVHFVVYELPGPTAPPPTLPFTLPGKLHGKAVKAHLALPQFAPMSAPVSNFDSNAFYESAFSAEGAHRILYTDADAYKLVMVGFPERKGYAFAVSGAGYVAVSRTDGYPNLEALTAFVSRFTSAVMNSKMVKDAVSGTMGGDKK